MQTNPKTVAARGSTSMEVAVSHVVDPSKFYVCHHSTDSVNLHKSLVNRFAVQMAKAHNVLPGKCYVVYDLQFSTWFRGICLCPSGWAPGLFDKLFEFFNMDEGWSKEIPVSMVHKMDERLSKFTPMVFECSLHTQKPENGWEEARAKLFKTLLSQDKIQVTIYAVKNGVKMVDVSIIDLKSGNLVVKSVIEALNCKVITATPPAVVKKNPDEIKLRKYVNRFQGVKCSSSLIGRVVKVTTPDAFYIQFEEADIRKSALFSTELQQYYNRKSDGAISLKVSVARQGFPYVICFEHIWHRVLVEEVIDQTCVSLFLVDTGHRIWAKIEQLYHIQDEFLSYPVQATLCKLYGVCSKNPSGLWSAENCVFLKNLVGESRLTIFVEGVVTGSTGRIDSQEFLLSVVMYIGQESNSVNTSFVKGGHGVQVRELDLPSHNRVQSRASPQESLSPEQSVVDLLGAHLHAISLKDRSGVDRDQQNSEFSVDSLLTYEEYKLHHK